MIHRGSRLHYRCLFDLRLREGKTGNIADILKVIRSWLTRRIAQPNALGGRWFYHGGKWADPQNQRRHRLQTIAHHRDDDAPDVPTHWAVRYEHPDFDEQFRQWVIDIAVECLPRTAYRFSLTLSNHLLDGFVGAEPPPPAVSCPKIVSDLLKSPIWVAYSANDPLTSSMIKLEDARRYKTLEGILGSPDRQIPIILLTPDRDTGEQLLNGERLARLVQGTGVVIQVNSLSLNTQLVQLPEGYACHNGSVRIYSLKLDFNRPWDGKRHRYFTKDQILECGPKQIEDWIAEGVARRVLPYMGAISSVENIRDLNERQMIASLQRKIDASKPADKFALMESLAKTYATQNAELAQENDDLKAQLQEKEEWYEAFDPALKEAQAKLLAAEATIRWHEGEQARLRKEIDAAAGDGQEKLQAIESLQHTPESLLAVLGIVIGLYPDRIAVTDQGWKTAKNVPVPTEKLFREYLHCLLAVATTLRDLYLDDSTKDIEGEFKRRSGFEFTLREGAMTKQDNRLMSKREDEFEGQSINIMPHVKAAEDFRAYLCWVKDKKAKDKNADEGKVVIGRFGHLETYGTKRRKQ